jgi:ribonucleotide monophosphatase NagD (HAD superfamily)
MGWEASPNVLKGIHKAADPTTMERVGDYVRKTVAILDEARAKA